MSAIITKEKRNVIPRWRSFKDTVALGELARAPKVLPSPPRDEQLARRLWEWSRNRTIWHAADLVGCAFVLRRPEVAKEAAEFILSTKNSPAAAASLASRLLNQKARPTRPQITAAHGDVREVRGVIHLARQRLQEDPRNAIQWVDLALQYTVLGMDEQADRAINIATSLGRNNRFILRAASRFHVHHGDVERAHSLLKNAPSTRNDPWLLAAEIALAAAAGLPSGFARLGRRLLDDESINPTHLTELASELATLELSYGKVRNAKKLFRRSFTGANENSLAQAEWAWQQVSGHQLDMSGFDVPYDFEAQAWHAFQIGAWDLALANSKSWLVDQPFSRRPAILGSYVASSILEDYRAAAEISERSLLPNPTDPILLNNLAFAYANLDQLNDAQAALDKVDKRKATGYDLICLTATQGLVYYRQGRVEDGRNLYRQALRLAEQSKNAMYYAEALIHLALEEIRSGSDYAKGAVDAAQKAAEGQSSRNTRVLLERLRHKQAEHPIPPFGMVEGKQV